MADAFTVLIPAAAVLWVLLPAYLASAFATLPKGRGPPMDFGREWPWDHRRVLGPSKTWSGFLVGMFLPVPIGLLEAWLILIAPPNLAVVPSFGPTVVAAIPVVFLLTIGAMSGDALGSFIKRRLNRPSGSRALLLDQLPFVVVPVVFGVLLYPEIFVPVFGNLLGIFWLVFYTLVLHILFNWVGYRLGTKKVPW